MKPERMQRTSIFLSEKTIKEAKENGIIMSVICRKAIDKAIERVKNANEWRKTNRCTLLSVSIL